MIYVMAGLLLMAALYLAGWMPVRMMRAVVYLGNGSWRSRCFGASFTRCTGRIHRVLRVGESRSYSFRLSGHIQQGRMEVTVSKGSAPLLTLSKDYPTATVPLEKGRTYRLTLRFTSASGDYQLEWD